MQAAILIGAQLAVGGRDDGPFDLERGGASRAVSWRRTGLWRQSRRPVLGSTVTRTIAVAVPP